ncbi:MAG TPA: sugar ABC transporter permease [Actinocrinis sp.]|nr:sugar ABC transporter permease [Actinocrinis sp.]
MSALATTAPEPAVRSGRTRRPVRDFRRSPWGLAYSAPAVLIFALFIIIPTGYTFYVSLWHWQSADPAYSKFLGVKNYTRLFEQGSPSFLGSFAHSLYFASAMVVGGTAISLGCALLLQRGGRLLNTSRLAVYMPHATPVIATSMAWVWIFDPQFGLANWALRSAGLPTSAWLSSSGAAMPAVIVYSLWHEVGFTTVIFLGGLAVISDELGEAAQVDGCTPWQEFWHITWAQLRPVVTFVVLLTTITSLQAFTQFYEMAQGGPDNATTTLSYLIFYEAISLADDGYGAAIAVVLFFITVFFTLVRRRTTSSESAGLY